jgi:hypothetical protein
MAGLTYGRNGIIVDEEKSGGSKISWIIRAQNQALVKEQNWDKKNRCPVCHITKSKAGTCNCNDYD